MSKRKPFVEENRNGSGAVPDTPTPAKRRRRRLSTLGGVRRLLASVIVELEGGEREVAVARTLIYAAATLAGVIDAERKQNEFDQRIQALEERLGAVSSGGSNGKH